MNKPKVSIIFPFYNCNKYLEFSVKSLCCLKSDDFQLIAINDGSTDDSLKTFQKLSVGLQIDFFLISNTSNKGCFKARTEAIKASIGDLIVLFDADDVLLPKRMKKQLRFLDKNKDIWCVGSLANRRDSNM